MDGRIRRLLDQAPPRKPRIPAPPKPAKIEEERMPWPEEYFHWRLPRECSAIASLVENQPAQARAHDRRGHS